MAHFKYRYRYHHPVENQRVATMTRGVTATERQRDYIRKLCNELGLPYERIEGKVAASLKIDELKKLKKERMEKVVQDRDKNRDEIRIQVDEELERMS